jgi:hypothetical protein
VLGDIARSVDVERVLDRGPSLVVTALGRLLGLGPAERRALGENGAGSAFPAWGWMALAVGVGFIAGSRVQKKWPRRVPKMISG